MTTFYLAAKYSKRKDLLPIAAALLLHGYGVTSQWLNGTHDGTSEEDSQKYAKLDLTHINNATTFVLFNLPIGDVEPSSGRNVEFGYALAKGKFLIVVGEGNCIFYTQAQMFFPTVEAFMEYYVPGSKL